MNDNNSKATSSAVSLTTLLQVAFIVLKLCKVIDWSWWAVLIPIWIDLGCLALGGIVVLVLALHENRKIKKLLKKMKKEDE